MSPHVRMVLRAAYCRLRLCHRSPEHHLCKSIYFVHGLTHIFGLFAWKLNNFFFGRKNILHSTHKTCCQSHTKQYMPGTLAAARVRLCLPSGGGGLHMQLVSSTKSWMNLKRIDIWGFGGLFSKSQRDHSCTMGPQPAWPGLCMVCEYRNMSLGWTMRYINTVQTYDYDNNK